MNIQNYISNLEAFFIVQNQEAWKIIQHLEQIMLEQIQTLWDDYEIIDHMAVHKTAVIESNVTIKWPAIIGKDCFIGANSYLRNGVFLWTGVKIWIWCEIKSSIICSCSSIAHLNFIGDSIIWENVNFEGGSLTANHYNEREDKDIFIRIDWDIINTWIQKFWALVGDSSKIWANAVLSPGTILGPNSIVKRLELVEQIQD